MLQVRIHGRGGQGVVTAAELLALAAFDEGRYAQAFPSFGSERMGAPVVSFCRIDEREIRVREPVMAPDVLIVIDPTLLHQVDVFGGLTPEGFILINTTRSFDELGLGEFVAGFRHERLLTVPAGELAREHLVPPARPIANAALLGGFAALSGLVSLDAVVKAIRERFTGNVGEGNVAAAMAAYAWVADERRELSGAASG
jgi:pyruvate ferredoxin oxidoreductase gamma subunit